MRNRIALLSALLIGCCLTGCEKNWADTKIDSEKALIVTPAGTTKASDGKRMKDGTFAYPIGSVFCGGGVADPQEGSSHRCHFYQEKFTEGPRRSEVESLVAIYGFRYRDVEYTEPGQYIDHIYINGLDASLGLGTSLMIPMNQGKYNGENELIKDVQIKSYKLASYNDNEGHQNPDADIHIVITSKAGDIITIRFANGVTPHDGYY